MREAKTRVSPAKKMVKKTKKVSFCECALVMRSSASVPCLYSSGCVDAGGRSEDTLFAMQRKQKRFKSAIESEKQ